MCGRLGLGAWKIAPPAKTPLGSLFYHRARRNGSGFWPAEVDKNPRANWRVSAHEVVSWRKSYDNCRRRHCQSWSKRKNAMNIIFSLIREDTFWKILLFVHFLLAVG